MSPLDAPTRRPGIVLAVAGVVTLALGAGLARVQIDASIRTLVVADDPSYRAHEAHKARFGSDEILSIAIAFDDALAPDALRLQQEVVWALEELEGVIEIDAVATQDDVVGREAEITVEPLVSEALEDDTLSGETLSQLRSRVAGNPIWRGWLVSESGTTAAIQVRLDDSPEGEAQRTATLQQIDRVLAEVLGDTPYHLAGHPFMKFEIGNTIAADLGRLLPLTLAVMTTLLLLTVGSVRVGLLTIACVLLAVVWMVGAMGWLGLDITALSNAAPSILVALATAYYLHLTAAFQSGSDPRRTVRARQALERVRRPMLIAGGTTAIGYASLTLSSVPIVRSFGLDLALGVLAATAIGCFVLPALFALVPSGDGGGGFGASVRVGIALFRLTRINALAPRAILAAAIALAITTATLATGIEVDSSGPKRFGEDSRFNQASRFYRAQLSGDVVENVYLEAPEGDFTDPDRLRRMQAFQRAALELPQIDKAISIADYVARIYWVFRGETGDPNEIPDSAASVSQLLLLYESSGDPDEFSDLLTTGREHARILLKATVLSSQESAALRARLEALAREYFPEESGPMSVLSTEILLSRAADVISVEQIRSALVALVLILALITASFGSLRAGGLMLLPNLLPLLLNLGIMASVGIPLSDATSIISATALGIAVDSTVHLLGAARASTARHGSTVGGVLESLVTTGRPVVVTSLVVILGFSMLLFSDFRSVAELGGLTALTMLYCLIADLLVLPSQLLAFQAPRDRESAVLIAMHDRAWPAMVKAQEGDELVVELLTTDDSAALASKADRVLWLGSGRTRDDVPVRSEPSRPRAS